MLFFDNKQNTMSTTPNSSLDNGVNYGNTTTGQESYMFELVSTSVIIGPAILLISIFLIFCCCSSKLKRQSLSFSRSASFTVTHTQDLSLPASPASSPVRLNGHKRALLPPNIAQSKPAIRADDYVNMQGLPSLKVKDNGCILESQNCSSRKVQESNDTCVEIKDNSTVNNANLDYVILLDDIEHSSESRDSIYVQAEPRFIMDIDYFNPKCAYTRTILAVQAEAQNVNVVPNVNLAQNANVAQNVNLEQNVILPDYFNLDEEINFAQNVITTQNYNMAQNDSLPDYFYLDEKVNLAQNDNLAQTDNMAQNDNLPDYFNLDEEVNFAKNDNLAHNDTWQQSENLAQSVTLAQNVNLEQNVNLALNVSLTNDMNLSQNFHSPEYMNLAEDVNSTDLDLVPPNPCLSVKLDYVNMGSGTLAPSVL